MASDDSPSFVHASLRLGGWLRDHGVDPVIERCDPDEHAKDDWLLKRAADFGSDLVVMGATDMRACARSCSAA